MIIPTFNFVLFCHLIHYEFECLRRSGSDNFDMNSIHCDFMPEAIFKSEMSTGSTSIDDGSIFTFVHGNCDCEDGVFKSHECFRDILVRDDF